MPSFFPLARPSRVLRAFHQIRCNSTEVIPKAHAVTLAPKSPTTSKKRPHLGIEVDPNHGLWAFFRKREADGVAKYETLEARESLTESGRPWHAAELRRKSFRDLHTLWYVLLRERNLLATQREEARRMGIQNPEALAAPTMERMCRKSMARLKFVLNERRLHYEKLSKEGVMPQEELLKVPEPPAPTGRMTRRERMAARREASSSPGSA